jgi:general secretion pathway protein N
MNNLAVLMRRWRVEIALGLGIYIVFLIAEAPASLLERPLNRLTNAVELTDTRGTVWHGGGVVAAAVRQDSKWIGAIRWEIKPLRLLAGKLCVHFDLTPADGSVSGDLVLSRGALSLLGLKGRLPVQLAQYFFPAIAALGPAGQIEFGSSSLLYGKPGFIGNLEGSWRDAACALSNVNPLGDYHLLVQGQGLSASLWLTTIKGELVLEGQGQWQPLSNHLQFSGSARPLTQTGSLEPLLAMIGPDSGGQRNFSIDTNLLKS